MQLSDIRKLNLSFEDKKICDAELRISTQNTISMIYPSGKACTNPSSIKVSLIGFFSDSEEDDTEDTYRPDKKTVFEYHKLASAYRSSEYTGDDEENNEAEQEGE